MFKEIITSSYFRIFIVCLVVALAERVKPWRTEQKFARPALLQDVCWFAINIYLFNLIATPVFSSFNHIANRGFYIIFNTPLTSTKILNDLSIAAQIITFLIVADFFEWCIHNLLHRIPWLWRIHRVHHSISTMDWIGNFRFHPVELLVYHFLKYIPLALLGAGHEALVVCGTISMFVGNLNHSNLNISFGPLRYLFNSPRMHIWHHDAVMRNRSGVNFGVVLSVWDWLFKTAYMPLDKTPKRLGFKGDNKFPKNLAWRLFLPFANQPKKKT